jgi:hypothetical protein
MTFLNMTGFKLMAAAFVVSAAMATPIVSPAQAMSGMKVAMAMPMHAGSKMARHGKRHTSHYMAVKHAANDATKDNDRYGMK